MMELPRRWSRACPLPPIARECALEGRPAPRYYGRPGRIDGRAFERECHGERRAAIPSRSPARARRRRLDHPGPPFRPRSPGADGARRGRLREDGERRSDRPAAWRRRLRRRRAPARRATPRRRLRLRPAVGRRRDLRAARRAGHPVPHREAAGRDRCRRPGPRRGRNRGACSSSRSATTCGPSSRCPRFASALPGTRLGWSPPAGCPARRLRRGGCASPSAAVRWSSKRRTSMTSRVCLSARQQSSALSQSATSRSCHRARTSSTPPPPCSGSRPAPSGASPTRAAWPRRWSSSSWHPPI